MRMREVVNLYDGKRLGRIIDISFEKESGKILGFIVPALKRTFRKGENIFIPLDFIKKIGEDVILVRLEPMEENKKPQAKPEAEERVSYARYRRIPSKE